MWGLPTDDLHSNLSSELVAPGCTACTTSSSLNHCLLYDTTKLDHDATLWGVLPWDFSGNGDSVGDVTPRAVWTRTRIVTAVRELWVPTWIPVRVVDLIKFHGTAVEYCTPHLDKGKSLTAGLLTMSDKRTFCLFRDLSLYHFATDSFSITPMPRFSVSSLFCIGF